jgi:hypothetical protein
MRLHQGERQKASRGELRLPLPAGLAHDRAGLSDTRFQGRDLGRLRLDHYNQFFPRWLAIRVSVNRSNLDGYALRWRWSEAGRRKSAAVEKIFRFDREKLPALPGQLRLIINFRFTDPDKG